MCVSAWHCFLQQAKRRVAGEATHGNRRENARGWFVGAHYVFTKAKGQKQLLKVTTLIRGWWVLLPLRLSASGSQWDGVSLEEVRTTSERGAWAKVADNYLSKK